MKSIFFRILFSLSSFLGILLFLFINRNTNIPIIYMPSFLGDSLFLKYLIILIFVIGFAKFVLFISEKALSKSDNISVSRIKPAEGNFLPVYIGLFVIALSFNNEFSIQTQFLILLLFILWFLFENVSYFNPFFLFCGYHFYEVESESNITIIVITRRKDIKKIKSFNHLTRINNFTFLEY